MRISDWSSDVCSSDLPELAPDVMILWYCEPDNSYHYRGIGTDANLAALRHVDAEFGRILAWRDSAGLTDSLQIVTMSDHGQITVAAESVDIAAAMREAGFTVGETTADGSDAALALSSGGGLYVRDSDPDLTRAILAWLQAQPWCGPRSEEHTSELQSIMRTSYDVICLKK